MSRGASALNSDVVIVGGGLAGGLVASALVRRRPELRIALVEAQSALGGNHLWSFFDSDIDPAERWLTDPLVCHRWGGYQVRFGATQRTFQQTYQSIEFERLDQHLRGLLPAGSLVTGTAVSLDRAGVTLSDGRRIVAGGVIDARGSRRLLGLDLGWQKFLGRLLKLSRPHGIERPIIMDAAVDQADGYRFVYVLPFGPDSVFVEDTYYSTDPDLDRDLVADRVDSYAEQQGWTVLAVERQEAACLPIVMGGAFDRLWREGGAEVPKIGMAAGLFHPMTGYSLPDAVRTAALIATLPDLRTAALNQVLRGYAESRWGQRGFYRLLARLLFRAAEPRDRWRVLARFYRLDEDLIARFYAGRSTGFDKLRVLAGKPPVPLGRAISVLRERKS